MHKISLLDSLILRATADLRGTAGQGIVSWAAAEPGASVRAERLCAPVARRPATRRGARRSWRPPWPQRACRRLCAFEGVRGAPKARGSGEGARRGAAPRASTVLACLLGVPPAARRHGLSACAPCALPGGGKLANRPPASSPRAHPAQAGAASRRAGVE